MRHQLKQWAGRAVLYSGRALKWEQRGESLWLLLKNVFVALHEPHLTGNEMNERMVRIDHVWVIVPLEYREQLKRYARTRLMGEPYHYTRLDGTEDYAIGSREFVNLAAAHDDWIALANYGYFDELAELSQTIIDAWEVEGIPLCNMTQSTNTVLAVMKDAVERVKNYKAKLGKSRGQRRHTARMTKNRDARVAKALEPKQKRGFG